MIVRSKAPLRLGFAGGGTDIASYYNTYGGAVLNATIDLYAYCTIVPTEDRMVRVHAADLGVKDSQPADDRLALDQRLRLHEGIYRRIVETFNGGRHLSFDMTTYSDAPAGSGLGSSSTMVVAIVKAFVEWLNLPLGEYDIASLAYDIERVDLGLLGGRQDQYAATFGGFNFMEFQGNDQVIVNPLRVKRWIRNELENSLILYYTGVSRESAHIIQQQIANAEKKNEKSLESMHEIKRQSVVMKEALLKGDFPSFARSLEAGWLAKRGAADSISNPDIDGLHEFVLKNGAVAAKISGAGGGGFMMIYVDPLERVRLISALKDLGGRVMTPSFTEIGTQAWVLR